MEHIMERRRIKTDAASGPVVSAVPHTRPPMPVASRWQRMSRRLERYIQRIQTSRECSYIRARLRSPRKWTLTRLFHEPFHQTPSDGTDYTECPDEMVALIKRYPRDRTGGTSEAEERDGGY